MCVSTVKPTAGTKEQWNSCNAQQEERYSGAAVMRNRYSGTAVMHNRYKGTVEQL